MAISDTRSLEPTQDELTHVVGDALVGGSLGGKAGISHFHVGDGKKRLKCLNDLLDAQEAPPEYLYPTHVNRADEVLQEAVKLVARGTWADMDTVDGGLGKALRRWLELGGTLEKLTVSTDTGAEGAAPHKLWRELRSCVQAHGFALEEVLPLATKNTAAALRFDRKGRIAEGMDADVLVLERETLEITHVFARGRQLVENGQMMKRNGK
jgi:beta-aspartyl-dipeptidase (metallo-type)